VIQVDRSFWEGQQLLVVYASKRYVAEVTTEMEKSD
jgi:hypothetical protein